MYVLIPIVHADFRSVCPCGEGNLRVPVSHMCVYMRMKLLWFPCLFALLWSNDCAGGGGRIRLGPCGVALFGDLHTTFVVHMMGVCCGGWDRSDTQSSLH